MTTIKEQNELRDKVLLGLEKTYEKLIEFKKSKNSPLIIMKDGEIIELNPHGASLESKIEEV
ncbi:MAG: hypothetical protein ACI8WW_002990 [Oceanospirillaceae bacterium]|jgi:hypothetical protein